MGNGTTCGISRETRLYCWGKAASSPKPTLSSEGAVQAVALHAALPYGTWHVDGAGTVRSGYPDGTNYPLSLVTPLMSVTSGGYMGTVPGGSSGGRPGPGPVLHACGLAEDGRAFCWGDDQHGQRGDGPATSASVVPVSGGVGFQMLSADAPGGAHTCGISRQAHLFCWGRNVDGELGVRTEARCSVLGPGVGTVLQECSPVPVAVAPEREFRSVSVGGRFTCAVDGEGAAYCWGANDFGNLGNGGWEAAAEPVPVVSQQRFTHVSAGTGYACAVTESHEIYCWGANSARQLGDGTTESRSVPTRVRVPGS